MKKGKIVKKLDFAGEDASFIFQPWKPMTRFAKKSMEIKMTEKVIEAMQPYKIIDLSPTTAEEVFLGQRKGKEKMI